MVRKIVFINQSCGYLTTDIINHFAKEYDEVALIYGTKTEIKERPLHSKVKKSRVIGKSRKSNFYRGLRWILANFQIFWLLLTKYRNYEIFYFTLPPFSYFCSLLLTNRYSIMIFDVYPDVLNSVGLKKNNLFYKLWGKTNRYLYPRAFKIYTISPSMADLIQQYVERSKIEIVSLWTLREDIKPMPKKENKFVINQEITEKFVVQYSGNIGPTHKIETLIESANLLRDNRDIEFLIIGRGTRVDDVKKLINQYQLKNCRVLPFQSEEMFPYSITAADLGVAIIGKEEAKVSLPSKIYNIMAGGCAVLCLAPQDSGLNDLVKKYNIGKTFDQEDYGGIRDFILSLKNNRELLKKYQENSRKASQNHKPDKASFVLQQHLNGSMQ